MRGRLLSAFCLMCLILESAQNDVTEKLEYECHVLEELASLKEEHASLREEISDLKQQNDRLQEILTRTTEDAVQKQGAATYVRWGRTSYPGNGSEMVYSGYAVGSNKDHPGGASNFLCLPADPQWGQYEDTVQRDGHVFGVEYEYSHRSNFMSFFGGGESVHNHDAPCAVCRSSRASVLMIPARTHCYGGWTLEYRGVLSTGYYEQAGASEYICVDDRPEVLPGGSASNDGKLLFFVEGRCGSLKCPPYVEGRELTCVVCTL